MRTEIAIAAGIFVLTMAAPAAASPREYNRGYYDCSHGQYDQDEYSHAYRQGCRDAQREQGGGPPPPGPGYDPDRGPPGGGQGWGPPPSGGQGWGPPPGGGEGWGPGGQPVMRAAGIPNVKGMDPGQVLTVMAQRGYRNVGTEVSGAAIYGFYFNPATRECVQVANMNGRAIGAVPVGSNPRCR